MDIAYRGNKDQFWAQPLPTLNRTQVLIKRIFLRLFDLHFFRSMFIQHRSLHFIPVTIFVSRITPKRQTFHLHRHSILSWSEFIKKNILSNEWSRTIDQCQTPVSPTSQHSDCSTNRFISETFLLNLIFIWFSPMSIRWWGWWWWWFQPRPNDIENEWNTKTKRLSTTCSSYRRWTKTSQCYSSKIRCCHFWPTIFSRISIDFSRKVMMLYKPLCRIVIFWIRLVLKKWVRQQYSNDVSDSDRSALIDSEVSLQCIAIDYLQQLNDEKQRLETQLDTKRKEIFCLDAVRK